MLTVVLIAFASATCSAMSSVVKHLSAGKMRHSRSRRGRALAVMASMVGSPLWLAGLAFDGAGVTLQVLALRYGELSVVQPVLTVSLVISLIGSHVAGRRRVPVSEIAWSAVLISGLVLFLFASNAFGAKGEAAVGSRGQAIALGGLAAITVIGAVIAGHRVGGRRRASLYAVAVAVLYAVTASLIKTCTRIVDLRGLTDLVLAWQLWALVACGLLAMVLAQLAFAAGPLTRSLPVIASLDPLFSLVAGVVVYGERLGTTPLRLIGETTGLLLLTGGVAGLGRLSAQFEQTHPTR